MLLADARGGADLELRFRPGTTAGDLAAAWPGDHVGPLVVDDRAWPDDTPLGECGVVDGATVGVGLVPDRRPALVVVAGPLAPAGIRLDGPVLIGRGADCDLRLDHPSVADAHALVEPSWTVCSLERTILVDGEEIGAPRPLAAGVVLSVGDVDLQLVTAEPPVVVPPPHAPIHRAARPPDPVLQLEPAPVPPDEPPVPPPPGLLTVAAPVALGGVLAVAIHPTAGLISAAMPLLAVGTWLDARRRHRRDRRRALAAHADALAGHEVRAASVTRQQAALDRRRWPSAADALDRVRRGVDLGVGDVDRLAVGWSVTTGRALGIAGPPDWADAVARALTLQTLVLGGPPPSIEVSIDPAGLTDGCRALLVWSPDGARLSDLDDGRREVPVRPFVAGADLARRTTRLRARWRDPGADLPDEVRLTSLLDGSTSDGRRSLTCPLGVSVDGPAVVDLVADGPHALVAGTTGSGKSELLRTWVAGLAHRHPPSAVAFVLVDYKGGSAFDACAALPHVTGVVTDLDPGLGERLLAGLRAEVRDREATLRAAGAGDLRDLGDGPPRLVVVVDEFATLAAELPDLLTALVDVARRGRSLGLHLVLATQRPSGAVSDDIRANTALRIALRTLDAADSHDVIGTAAAVDLPCPGRAWVGDRLVQVATTGLPPAAAEPPLVLRRVDEPAPASAGDRTELDDLVAESWPDHPAPAPTWLPPLTDHLALDGTLGLVDRPAARAQVPLRWDPADGHLCVVGGRRSGKTSALLAAVATHDRPVRADVHDRARLRRLLGWLEGREALLVVDDYDELAARCDDADGVRLLEALDRLLRRPGLAVALSSGRPNRLPPSMRATAAVSITLRLDDPADLALAGLRRTGREVPPGRGWTADGEEVQLVAPPDPATIRWTTPDPLPSVVHRARLDADGLVLGLRDADVRPATIAHPPPVFVVSGPPCSGRTTALDLVAGQLDLPVLRVEDAEKVRAWLEDPLPQAFVLDDAERLADPDGLLRELVNRRHPDGVVLVGVRSDAWRSSYGTWLADLRPAADGIALRPDPVHDAELWTTPLSSVGTDAPPGRGVHQGEVIQVALP